MANPTRRAPEYFGLRLWLLAIGYRPLALGYSPSAHRRADQPPLHPQTKRNNDDIPHALFTARCPAAEIPAANPITTQSPLRRAPRNPDHECSCCLETYIVRRPRSSGPGAASGSSGDSPSDHAAPNSSRSTRAAIRRSTTSAGSCDGSVRRCRPISQANPARRQRPRTADVIAQRRVRCWEHVRDANSRVPADDFTGWPRRFNSSPSRSRSSAPVCFHPRFPGVAFHPQDLGLVTLAKGRIPRNRYPNSRFNFPSDTFLFVHAPLSRCRRIRSHGRRQPFPHPCPRATCKSRSPSRAHRRRHCKPPRHALSGAPRRYSR